MGEGKLSDDGGAVGLERPGVGLGRSRAPAQSVWSYQLLLPVRITFSARRETTSRALPPGEVDVTGRSLLALAVGRTWKRRRERSAHFIGKLLGCSLRWTPESGPLQMLTHRRSLFQLEGHMSSSSKRHSAT